MTRSSSDADGVGRVLVLTGPSSGGKSATAREFQSLAETPWLILDADVVLAAFPFTNVSDLAATARRLNRGLFASAAAFARQGLDVVCEQVFWSEDNYRDAVACLEGVPARFVQVTADLVVSEQREARRDERAEGTARQQHESLFSDFKADHVLDTSTVSAAGAAAQLLEWVMCAFPAGRHIAV